MRPQDIDKVLKRLGISSGIIIGLLAVGVGSYLYINYLTAKKFSLEIKKLKRDLGEQKS